MAEIQQQAEAMPGARKTRPPPKSQEDDGFRDESYFVDGQIPGELIGGLTRPFTDDEESTIRHRVHLSSAAQGLEHPRCLWICGPSAVGKSTIAALKSQDLFGSEKNAVVVDGGVLRTCHRGWMKVVENGFRRKPRPQIHREAWNMLKSSKVIETKKKAILQQAVSERRHIVIPDVAVNLVKTFEKVKLLDKEGYEQHLVCLWAPREVCRRRGEGRQVEEGKTFSMRDYLVSVSNCADLAEYFLQHYAESQCSIMTTDKFPNLYLKVADLREFEHIAKETKEGALGGRKSLAHLELKRLNSQRLTAQSNFATDLTGIDEQAEPDEEDNSEGPEDRRQVLSGGESDADTTAADNDNVAMLKRRIRELEVEVASLRAEASQLTTRRLMWYQVAPIVFTTSACTALASIVLMRCRSSFFKFQYFLSRH
jgi:2-phosphoglycerate kinase